ncbi:radical SAM protein [Selenomonadales bacterium OttesenSCG-928-I06]|nr:radical SAM protein [Selenomonadales bacterium OttesenSCG-928-I06]
MKNHIIPVFIPHLGCKHNCVFCNQKKIANKTIPITQSDIKEIIDFALNKITNRENLNIEIAFYGGSFTALPLKKQEELLEPAYDVLIKQKIDTIRISTRPDCINDEIVEQLQKYKVKIIELGVQSLDNYVLKKAQRGHTSNDVLKSIHLLKQNNFICGIQLMPGLPGENWHKLIQTCLQTISLKPNFVRIYPTIVIIDTELSNLYKKGLYNPLTLEEAVVRTAYLKLMFRLNNIPVIRTGLQATDLLSDGNVIVKGPYHPSFGEMVDSYLFYIALARFLEEIINYDSCHNIELIVYHNNKDSSKIRGINCINIEKMKNKYQIKKITFIVTETLKKGEILAQYKNIKFIINL